MMIITIMIIITMMIIIMMILMIKTIKMIIIKQKTKKTWILSKRQTNNNVLL